MATTTDDAEQNLVKDTYQKCFTFDVWQALLLRYTFGK
jgi:hypothetical protein